MKSRDCGSIRGIYWLCGQLDDWIEPDMYECLLTALINENVDTAMCGRFEDSGESSRAMYHGFDEGRHDKTKLMQFVYPNMMVNKYFFEWGNFPGLWDKLFRRECLEDFQMAVEERLAMGRMRYVFIRAFYRRIAIMRNCRNRDLRLYHQKLLESMNMMPPWWQFLFIK